MTKYSSSHVGQLQHLMQQRRQEKPPPCPPCAPPTTNRLWPRTDRLMPPGSRGSTGDLPDPSSDTIGRRAAPSMSVPLCAATTKGLHVESLLWPPFGTACTSTSSDAMPRCSLTRPLAPPTSPPACQHWVPTAWFCRYGRPSSSELFFSRTPQIGHARRCGPPRHRSAPPHHRHAGKSASHRRRAAMGASPVSQVSCQPMVRRPSYLDLARSQPKWTVRFSFFSLVLFESSSNKVQTFGNLW
jgi:hypothetical protein